MTAAQKKAQARFKAAVAEAKKLRKASPKLSQAEAVKKAFQELYGAPKKRKKIGDFSRSGTKVKDEKGAKKYKKPDYKTTRKMDGTFRKWTKIGATKETRHTDTKSHNVNIRVMSGIHDELYKRRDEIETGLKRIEHTLHELKERLKKADAAYMKQRIKQGIAIHAAIQKNMKAELRKIHNVLTK